MKSKMIWAVIAIMCMFTVAANAQAHYGRGGGRGYYNGYRGGHYYNGGAYYGGRGYARGGYYGGGACYGGYPVAPGAYCAPVVIAPRPRYYAPGYAYGYGGGYGYRGRGFYGRPRVNLNIGF